LSLISYYSSLFSLEAGLVLVLTEIETEIVVALGISSRISNLLFLKTTRLFIYKLGGYLIYSNKELRYISRVP
jgi:hypothetical protein